MKENVIQVKLRATKHALFLKKKKEKMKHDNFIEYWAF